jgi:hypothetical protein
MKDLSIAQEYLLCSLNHKGGFSVLSTEQPICFVAATLLDLLSNDFVDIEGKKIIISRELEKSFDYLLPIFQFIQNSKTKTINDIVNGYSFSFTDKNLKALIQSVGGRLVAEGCAVEKNKTGLLGNTQKYMVPKKESTEHVIQKIRAELLEDGAISDETIALVSLLNKGGLLKQYFSKYESEELKKRLNEIKDSAPNQMIKQMLDYIDNVMAAIIAVTVMPK